jgi:hypothetical protein
VAVLLPHWKRLAQALTKSLLEHADRDSNPVVVALRHCRECHNPPVRSRLLRSEFSKNGAAMSKPLA